MKIDTEMLRLHNGKEVVLRKLLEEDVAQCVTLFHNTVHSVNAKDYNAAQLTAWAPENISVADWWRSLSAHIAYVLVSDNTIVGFTDMDEKGSLDRLYVHKDWQRCGIATILLQKLVTIAKARGLSKIETEASITARPFFERAGFVVQQKQQKQLRGQVFVNYKMVKAL